MVNGAVDMGGLPFEAGELRTERTLLRPFDRRRDLADVVSLLGREDVTRYLDWEVHSAEEAGAALERWAGMRGLAEDGDMVYFAVEVGGPGTGSDAGAGSGVGAGTGVGAGSGAGAGAGVASAGGRGRVVGEIILVLESARDGRLEIGWIFHPDVHGRGFAGEAARAVLTLCFERLGAHKVVAKLDSRNTASAALAERLGMRREALLRDDHVGKGVWVSVAFHSVLAGELLGRSQDLR